MSKAKANKYSKKLDHNYKNYDLLCRSYQNLATSSKSASQKSNDLTSSLHFDKPKKIIIQQFSIIAKNIIKLPSQITRKLQIRKKLAKKKQKLIQKIFLMNTLRLTGNVKTEYVAKTVLAINQVKKLRNKNYQVKKKVRCLQIVTIKANQECPVKPKKKLTQHKKLKEYLKGKRVKKMILTYKDKKLQKKMYSLKNIK